MHSCVELERIREQLREIVGIVLDATRARLAPRGVALEVTEAAVDWLAENGYEPQYGARPLRRLVQRSIDDRIADLVVSGEVSDGGAVRVDAVAGELRVTSAAVLPLAA